MLLWFLYFCECLFCQFSIGSQLALLNAYSFTSLYCIVLYCIVLYCIVLYCIVLYCIVLYCIVLYCIVLYCIVLYCIVLYCCLCCNCCLFSLFFVLVWGTNMIMASAFCHLYTDYLYGWSQCEGMRWLSVSYCVVALDSLCYRKRCLIVHLLPLLSIL